MTWTLRNAITATQTTFDLVGSDELGEGDELVIESEHIRIRTAVPQTGDTSTQRCGTDRGVSGTREAEHDAAAVATAYDVSAGGSGIPQGGPASADLDMNEHVMENIGAAGFSFRVPFAGTLDIIAPDGGPGQNGGSIRLFSGAGDAGNDDPAMFRLNGGSGGGTPGFMDGNRADFTALKINGSPVNVATDPGDIASPAAATSEDVANKVNDLLAALRTAGLLISD